jgi:hypothetical protein
MVEAKVACFNYLTTIPGGDVEMFFCYEHEIPQ